MLYMVANDDARQHRTEIIKSYHNIFKETLIAMGFMGQIPTLLELNTELLAAGFLGKLTKDLQLI